MNFWNRIQTKLMLLLITIVLIPVIAIGIYAVYTSSNSLLNQQFTTQEQQLIALKQGVETFLTGTVSDIRFLSHSLWLEEFLALKQAGETGESIEKIREKLEQQFVNLSQSRKIYYQVRYLDETGQEIVRVDRDEGGMELVQKEKLQNKASRYYFTDAMVLGRGEIFVSPLDLNRERGQVEVPHKPVIRYATKVYYPNNKPAGIIITNVDAKGFLQPLTHSILADAKGYYLMHPEEHKRWGSKRDLNTNENLYNDLDKAKEILESVQTSVISKDYIINVIRVYIAGSNESWQLIQQIPKTEVFASIKQFLIAFTGILMVALLFAIILAFYFSSRITRPILQLTQMANKVSTGDLLTSAEINDKSEIGELAKAFERMRISMIKAMERLHKKSNH